MIINTQRKDTQSPLKKGKLYDPTLLWNRLQRFGVIGILGCLGILGGCTPY